MLTILPEKSIPQEGKASMHSSHDDCLSILAWSDYQAHSILQICPNFWHKIVIFLPTKVTLKKQQHYQNIL